MKKLLILFLMVNSFAFNWNGKVDWVMNYNQAKMLSKETHNPIFVDFALSHCPPCHWISSNIYTNEKVAKYMNSHFINLLYIVDEETPPNEIYRYFDGVTPTLIIIKNSKLKVKQVGIRQSWLENPANFINFLKEGE